MTPAPTPSAVLFVSDVRYLADFYRGVFAMEDPHRVNVFERWRTREALEAFRDGGPDDDLTSLIVRARVSEYEL